MSSTNPQPTDQNLFEREKAEAIRIGQEAIQKIAGVKVGQYKVGEKALTETARAAEILSTPYREYVAPKLTAALLVANSDYREQNKNLSVMEQLDKAQQDSKKSSADFYKNQPGSEWRRAISPGRAGIALIGKAAGIFTNRKLGTEKIDWSNPVEIEKYYSSGAAQFWSGFADVGFNFADPLLAVGKAAKVAKVTLVTRPIGTGAKGVARILPKQSIEKIGKDADAAAAGEVNGFTPYLKSIQEAKDIQPIIRFSFVANSANPEKAATSLLSAYQYAGAQGVADVVKVMAGDVNAFQKLVARDDELTVIANSITKRIDAVEENIRTIGSNINPGAPLNLSAQKIAKIEAENAKLIAEQEAIKKSIKEELAPINKERKNLETRIGVAERDPEKALSTTGTDTLFGTMNTTWSKYSKLENIRAAAAEVDANGYWGQADPLTHKDLTDQVAAHLNVKKPLVRMSFYLSPNAQLKEVPSGTAILDGIPSQFMYKEVNARLRQGIKISDMTPGRARELAEQSTKLVTAAERFKFLEKLEREIKIGIIRRQFPKEYAKLSPDQIKALETFVDHTISESHYKRAGLMRDVLEKNYTQIDTKSGSLMAAKHIEDLVNTLALQRAQKRGENAAVKQSDIKAVEAMLRENPMFVTQQPNIHFSTNMLDVSNVIKENRLTYKGFLEQVVADDLSSKKIKKMLAEDKSFREANQGGYATAFDVITSRGKQGLDRVTNVMDLYQTFIWKPTTLLSLKYTTRNVFEGYLRAATSMVEMNSAYGYAWTDMIRGFAEESLTSPERVFTNVKVRAEARANSKRLNKINNELVSSEMEIKVQVGKLKGKDSFANLAIKKRAAELPEELLMANDSVTMPLHTIMGKAKLITSSRGTKEDKIAAAGINNAIAKSLNTSGLSPREASMAKSLINGDYDASYKISLTMNSEEVARSLDHINESMKSLVSNMDKIDLETLSPGIATHIKEIAFYAERLDKHMDNAKLVFVQKDIISGKFVAAQEKASAKPSLKKAYEGKLEIAKGVYIASSFAGDAGELLRMASSARSSNIRMLNDDNRITAGHIFHDGYDTKLIKTDDPKWAVAHAERVNNILMKDALASRMIKDLAAGKSGQDTARDAIAWLKSSDPAAVRYVREEKYTFKEYEANNATVNDMVKAKMVDIRVENLPLKDEFGNDILINVDGKAQNLLEIAASGKFTPAISANMPITVRNPVMGTLERTPNDAKIWRNIVNNVFKFVGTLPEDHLVRHPFYNMVHDSEALRLSKLIRNEAKKQGKTAEEGDALVLQYSDKIKRTASTRAYKELMQRMYSVERYTDVGSFMRFVTPFYMAHQNSSRYWLGVTMRNPDVAVLLAKAYNAPYRAGVVQDEEGNVVSSGNPWSTRRDQIILGFGDKGIGKALRGFTKQDEIKFSPNAIDVITQGQLPILPTAGGPVGQTAVTLLIGATNPDAITQKIMGKNADDIVSKYIMPYYTKTQGKGVIDTTIGNLNPMNSWMVSAMAALTKGDSALATDEANTRFNSRFNAAHDKIVLDRMLNGQSLNEDEMVIEATKLATNSLWVEAFSSFLGPVVSGTLSTSRVREMETELNRLRKANGGDMDQAALDLTIQIQQKYNTPYASTISRVLTTRSTDNRLSMLSTPQTLDNLNKNMDLVEQIDSLFPDRALIGELLSSGDPSTDYSPFVEDKLFATKINGKALRERLNDPKERAKRQQYSMAWQVYFSNIEYIEADAAAKGISKSSQYYKDNYKPWKDAVKAKIGEQFPLWAAREQKLDLDKANVNLAIVNRMISDPNYMKTVGNNSDTVQGLKMYMDARKVFEERLAIEGARTGVLGADTNQNRWILEWRDATVKEIIKQHPSFERTYTRYLNDDVLETIPSFEELNKGL